MTVEIYPDRAALSAAAAGLFAQQARAAVEMRGRFDVLLSGGETPQECYRLLAREPLLGSVPWHAVHLFWGDERYVPYDHPQSNFGMVRRALLDHVPLAKGQIHPVPYGPTPAESARTYEEELRGHFAGAPPRFDLVLLGLGEDGHTASLFPESALLAEEDRWVREVHPAGQDYYRVSVTPPILNQAALVVFLVQGSAKAAILHEVLEGPFDPKRLPAQSVHPSTGRLLWLVDRKAADLLSEKNVSSIG